MSLNPEVFDESLKKDVSEMSDELKELITRYREKVTANTMYTLLQFFCAGLMEDIRSEVVKRIEERLELEMKEQDNG